MPRITVQNGRLVIRDGKVGTEQGCCCGGGGGGGGGGCGRCVVPPHDVFDGGGFYRVRDSYAEPRWRTQAECERCRMCVEHLLTACDGSCPEGSGPSATPLVTLEFSAECGSGAAGTVTVGCGSILSATITNGGSGYATETITEPTLTATVSGGTGGVLSINGYSKIVGGMFDGWWRATGISVVSGGSGYTNNSLVTLSLGANDEWAPSSGTPNIRIRTGIGPPGDDWTLTVYSTDGINLSAGVGLALSITLAPIQDYDGWFEATGVTITDGGSGYQVGELIIATVPPSGDFGETALTITGVDQDGAVTGLSLDFPGQHKGADTGVISSVVIFSNRASRKRAVSTCPVTVTVAQQAPSVGTGATITATVDSTPASPTFGRVTGLTVTNGGSGYVGLCERKTAVGSCDECSPRELPESATCDDTGGCPCGTWVVDSDQTACECCKWTNPDWGVALMNLSDGHGGQIQYMDKEVECGKLRDKLRLIRSYFEQAGWTVTLDENWCPANVLDVWATTHGGDPDDIQIPLYPEDPCACGFLFRAECESCNRAYPAHIWTQAYTFLTVDDPELGLRQFEARPFDLSQWVEMPIEDWQHDVPTPYVLGIVPLWPISFGGFARVVYCEGLHAPSGVTIHKNPLGSSVPVFNFAKVGFQNVLLYGDFYISGQIHGGGLIPGYYSRGTRTDYDYDTFEYYQRGGKIYIPKCGVEITERARCVLTAPGEQLGTTGPVLDETWATCCTECPAGYRCLFAGDPLDGLTPSLEENPFP